MAVGGALFGPSTTRTSGPKALVEFRAGKMTFNESTKMVSPDKRKGMLSVLQVSSSLLSFIIILSVFIMTTCNVCLLKFFMIAELEPADATAVEGTNKRHH